MNKKKIYLRENHLFADFINAVYRDKLDKVHIPHSDVFFVRAALEKRTGIRFSLQQVETAMKAEGWSEGRILKSDHRYKGNKNV
tara:strand:+ start:172 stop:423 length:252 start_codon:yes stop_codon:yes gene_type:complete